MIMTIIYWVILGAIAGFIASYFDGKSRSFTGNLIVGIIGSVVGGFIANLLGFDFATFSIAGLLVATAGSVLVLYIYRKMK